MIDYGDPLLMDRYWQKVYPCPITGCWLWGAAVTPGGYGKIGIEGKTVSAYVMMAQIANVEGSGPVVRHRCDNPPCVNPDHLIFGTHRQNTADMHTRGRAGRKGAVGSSNSKAKLNEALVEQMRHDFAGGVKVMELVRTYKVGISTVQKILDGRFWRHVPGPLRPRRVGVSSLASR